MKCANCPVVGDRPCILENRNDTRVCRELLNPSHPDYNPAFVPIVLRDFGADPEHVQRAAETKPTDSRPDPTWRHSDGPGLMAKAGNLARAVVTHALAGFPEADEATAQARLATCKACPELDQSDPAKPTCKQCGCRMDVKIYWTDQRCPIGRW